MANTREVTCSSWTDFVQNIDQLRLHRGHLAHLFRGHANEGWRLRSSLGRVAIDAGIDEFAAIKIEKQLHESFIRHAHLLLPPSMVSEDGDLVHWWTMMQHYGAPTRLLDWTRSPFVALYFAVIE